MTLRERFRTGLRNPAKALRFLLRDQVIAVSSRYPVGTNVMDEEWDLLVVLDTCRVDALRAVAGEYDFLDDVGRRYSVGGSSPEWIAHTFDRTYERALAETAYLNVNGWAERVIERRDLETSADTDHVGLKKLRRHGSWDVVEPDEVGRLEHVWRYEALGDDAERRRWRETIPEEYRHGRAPPRRLTDRAVAVGREADFDRVIVHYTQPHVPYIGAAAREGRELREYEIDPFGYVKRTGDRETAFEAYLDELRYVLDDVSVLFDNFDADRAVVSADHGEAFGEYGVFDHHAGSLHPQIRYVPWTKTTTTDSGSYTPVGEPKTAVDRSVDRALEALGYRT